jgi:hypothetical protein
MEISFSDQLLAELLHGVQLAIQQLGKNVKSGLHFIEKIPKIPSFSSQKSAPNQ